MKDSVIITCFINIYRLLSIWYHNSVLAKVLDAVYDFISACIRTSVIGRFFSAPSGAGTHLEHSVFFKCVSWLYALIKKPSGTFRDVRETVKSTSVTYGIMKNLLYISTRFYGAIMLLAGFFAAALLYINTTEIFSVKMIISGVFVFAGLLFMMINRLPANLAKGSKFLCFITSFFVERSKVDVDNKLYLHESEYRVKNRALGLLAGLFIGFLLFALEPMTFVLVTGGFFGALLILKYTEAGLFIAVAGAPVLPTMGLAGVILLCVVSLGAKILSDPKFHFRTDGFDLFVLLFMGAVLYGAIVSFDFKGSLQMALVYLVFIMIYFVMTNILYTKRKWKMFFAGFVLSAAAVAVYGIAQNYLGFTSTETWLDTDMFTGIERRVYSTFDNPNVLGEFLILSITASVGLLWVEKWGKKPWYALMILAMAACMLFTWSRGAWLGLLAAIFVFAVIRDKRFAILVIAGMILLPFVAGDTIMSRLGSIGNMEDSSTAYRVSIWMSSVRMLRDFFFSGIGLGSNTYSAVYSQYAQHGATFALHSHNTFLQIGISMGVIGIISFFALLLGYFKEVYSKIAGGITRKNVFMLTMALAISSGVLGYLIQGMTDNVWYNYKMFLIFWIMLGFTVSALRTQD